MEEVRSEGYNRLYDNLINLSDQDVQRMMDTREYRRQTNPGNIFYDHSHSRQQPDHRSTKDSMDQNQRGKEDRLRQNRNSYTEESQKIAFKQRGQRENGNFRAGESFCVGNVNRDKGFDSNSKNRQYRPDANTVDQCQRGNGNRELANVNREKYFAASSVDQKYRPIVYTVDQCSRAGENREPVYMNRSKSFVANSNDRKYRPDFNKVDQRSRGNEHGEPVNENLKKSFVASSNDRKNLPNCNTFDRRSRGNENRDPVNINREKSSVASPNDRKNRPNFNTVDQRSRGDENNGPVNINGEKSFVTSSDDQKNLPNCNTVDQRSRGDENNGPVNINGEKSFVASSDDQKNLPNCNTVDQCSRGSENRDPVDINREKSSVASPNDRKNRPNVNAVDQRSRGSENREPTSINRDKRFVASPDDRKNRPNFNAVDQRSRGSENRESTSLNQEKSFVASPDDQKSRANFNTVDQRSRGNENRRPANSVRPRATEDRRPANSSHSRDNEHRRQVNPTRSRGSEATRPVKMDHPERRNGNDSRQSQNTAASSSFTKNATNKLWKPTRAAGYLNVTVTQPLSKSEYIVLDNADSVALREIDESPKKRLTSRPMLNEKYLCAYYNEYYRVKITNLQPMSALFLDHGSEERIEAKDLFEIPPEWREIDPMAFKIVLSPAPSVQFEEHTRLTIKRTTNNTWEIVHKTMLESSAQKSQRSQNGASQRSSGSTSSKKPAQPAVAEKAERPSNETAIKSAQSEVPIPEVAMKTETVETEPKSTNAEIQPATSVEETPSETATDEFLPEISAPEPELYTLVEEPELETVHEETEPETTIEETNSEITNDETESVTTNDGIEPETLPEEVEAKTETEPETLPEEAEAKTETESQTPIDETKPETTNRETVPETLPEETEAITTNGGMEPEPKAEGIQPPTSCSDDTSTREDEPEPIANISTIVEESQTSHDETELFAEEIQHSTVQKEPEEISDKAESNENEPESGPTSLEEFQECSDNILISENELESVTKKMQSLAIVNDRQEYSDESSSGEIELHSAAEEFQECTDEITTSENELESDGEQTQLPDIVTGQRDRSNEAPADGNESEYDSEGMEIEVPSMVKKAFRECWDETMIGEDKPTSQSPVVANGPQDSSEKAEPESIVEDEVNIEKAQLSWNRIPAVREVENDYVHFESVELDDLSDDLQYRLPVTSLNLQFSIEQLVADEVAIFVPYVRFSKTIVAGILVPGGMRKTISSMNKQLRDLSPDPDYRPKAGDLVTAFFEDAFRALILHEPTPLRPRYTVFCIDSGHVHESSDAQFAPLPSKFEKIPAASVVCKAKCSPDDKDQMALSGCCEYDNVKFLFKAQSAAEEGRCSGLMKRASSNAPFAVEVEKFWPPLGDVNNLFPLKTGDRVQLLPFEVSNKCVIIPANEDINDQRTEMLDHVNVNASKSALEEDPRRFEVVCVEYKGCLWRAKVLEQERKLFRVQLIDRGEELLVPRDQMRALPEYLKTILCMATPVRLKNVSVNELNRHSRKVLENFFKQCYSFELFVEEDGQVTLKFLKDVNYDEMYTKYDTVNEFLDDYLKPFWRQCIEKKLEFTSVRARYEQVIVDENDWIVGETLPLLVTSISPDGFIMVSNKNGPSWRLFREREVEDRILEYALTVEKTYCPVDNELCIAKSENGSWGRAVCFEAHAGSALRLQFLDSGRSEDVEHTNIRRMQGEFIHYPLVSIEARVLNAGNFNLEDLKDEVGYFRIVNLDPENLLLDVEIIMDDTEDE